MAHRITQIALAGMLLLFVAAAPAAAQVEIGVKGGLNLAKFAVDPDESRTYPFIYGPTGGIFVTAGTGPLAGQLEVLYSRRGTKVEEPTEEELFTLDNIDVPLLLRFNGATTNATTFFATVGPTISYNFRGQQEFQDGTEVDIKAAVEDLTYGISFGLGVQVEGVTLEGRYTHGLSEIFVNPAAGIETKHRLFTFLLGFGF
jgi:hypothetical protein